jgi:hypothetical protein
VADFSACGFRQRYLEVNFAMLLSLYRLLALLLSVSLLCSCAAIIRPVRDAISPPGEMNADGQVTPCHGYKSNHQACGDAIYNSRVISTLSLGVSVTEARAIIKRVPERKILELQDNQPYEVWWYLTDYERSVTTKLEFRSGKLASIRQEQ